MNRRQFLSSSIGALSAIAIVGSAAAVGVDRKRLYFSACTDDAGNHYIAAFNQTAQYAFLIAVPERAHDSLFLANYNQVIFFGRSPSKVSYVVDLNSNAIVQYIQAGKGRYFCGHGCITSDNYLCLTESNDENHEGFIGIYNPKLLYQRVTEYKTHGIGPHQLLYLQQHNEIVIANGGLIKDLSDSKKIINQDDFQSSIAYINAGNGQLRDQYFSEYKQLSLRHLTLGEDDHIYIGAQSYNDDILPLVFSHKRTGQIKAFSADEYIWLAHNQYTASLAFKNGQLAVTSPRGNLISFWDTSQASFNTQKALIDVAGLTDCSNVSDGFFATTGTGLVVSLNSKAQRLIGETVQHKIAWDNHLSTGLTSTQ